MRSSEGLGSCCCCYLHGVCNAINDRRLSHDSALTMLISYTLSHNSDSQVFVKDAGGSRGASWAVQAGEIERAFIASSVCNQRRRLPCW